MLVPRGQGCFNVRFRMKDSVDGGRQRPTPPGMFRTVVKHQTGSFSCGIFAGDDVCLTPGLEYDAEVLVLLEDARAGFLRGDDIEFWDGKIFASGKVTESI